MKVSKLNPCRFTGLKAGTAKRRGRRSSLRLKNSQVEVLCYFAALCGCFAAMPEQERQSLYEWEKENLNGSTVGTSDWPGWEKYIGRAPELAETEARA